MKILIIISNNGIGGAQKVAMHLATWINRQKNCKAKIVALKKAQGGKYDMEEYDYFELDNNHIIVQLRRIIKEYKPDILLSMGVPMAIYTVPASWLTGVRHIISERNDPRHFSGKRITRIFSRLLMRMADGFVFQTKEAQSYYKLSEGRRSTVIPNPIMKLEEIINYNQVDNREKIIVNVGRLHKQKNQRLLIDAFAEIADLFPEYNLVIWGEGNERNNLECHIKELNLEKRVFLPGSSDKVLEKIYKASAFVLSSDYEGMPNALMEAMALGIPCISSDCPCGGPRELIQDEINGYLFTVNNKEELVNKMKKLLSSPEIQNEFSKRARLIRQSYSANVICEKWMQYFYEVCRKE